MVLLADLYRRIYFMGGWGNLPGSTSSLFQAVIPRLGLRFILRARLMIMWLKCGMEEVLTKKLAHAGFEQHLLNIPWEHELRVGLHHRHSTTSSSKVPRWEADRACRKSGLTVWLTLHNHKNVMMLPSLQSQTCWRGCFSILGSNTVFLTLFLCQFSSQD